MKMKEEERITQGSSGKCTDFEIENLTEDQMMNSPEYLHETFNYMNSEYNMSLVCRLQLTKTMK